jgi:protein-L-isoaspartate(D-aspartate) O-methyltransferase
MALMLELLELAPALRVLEIGTGSGYNAALLAHIVGDAGSVTSLEIDEQLAAAARANLNAAGFNGVHVVHGDGVHGWPAGAPYDRVIATAAVAAIPSEWLDQMAPDCRLVAPVEGEAWQLVTAFERMDDRLVRGQTIPCGFISLRTTDFPSPAQ